MNTIAELGRLPQVPVDMTLEGLAALNRTQRSDQIGLEELARQQQFNRSADPMRLQQMQTSNDISLQDLGAKTRENRIANRLEPERVMAEYSKYLATAKEADVQLATSKWQEMAMSNDPAISNLGKQGLMRTKEFIMQKQKDDADLARVRQQGTNQLAVANVGAASRERVAALAAKARQEMNTLKSPKDWEEYAVRKQLELQQEGDMEARSALAQQIQFAQQMAERLKPAQQVIDPAASGGMLTDPRGTMPRPPGAAAPQNDRVRVVSPDGRVGNIPRSQLEQAKAQGYKESK
jgi:hypothetical protein